MVLEPLDGPVEDMAGGRVLWPHPRTISCYCLDPGKEGALHDLQTDVNVDPESQRCEGAFLTFLEAIGALGAWKTTCLGSLVSVRTPS